ncbi:MAG: DUF4279 domain-containing protein [Clostridia bacterium]|nr:DUF4279 domain-containing protein [Clostridia bacterium]
MDQQNHSNTVPWMLSLKVSGEGLDFAAIEQGLALRATDTRTKGELLNKLPPIVSEEDCWLYEIELSDNEGTDPRMHALLLALEAADQTLAALRARHEVALCLYVQSDYAQIFYRLMPDTLSRLARIGLPLEVSMVSWGGLRFSTNGT